MYTMEAMHTAPTASAPPRVTSILQTHLSCATGRRSEQHIRIRASCLIVSIAFYLTDLYLLTSPAKCLITPSVRFCFEGIHRGRAMSLALISHPSRSF
jgi:hypothetical protein